MPTFVKSIRALGLYGRFDIEQEFETGVNILYGRNGTGKTTLLHVLANALNGDFDRFAYLDFDEVAIHFDDATTLEIARPDKSDTGIVYVTPPTGPQITIIPTDVQKSERDRLREERYETERQTERARHESPQPEPVLPAAYFPAFRTMLEAWASVRSERNYLRRTGTIAEREQVTAFARELFGNFVPGVSYPSLPQIEVSLSEEVLEAWGKVTQVDRELLSSAFLRIFASLSATSEEAAETPEQLLQSIRALTADIQATPFEDKTGPTTDLYSQLRGMLPSAMVGVESESTAARVLDVYRDSLARLLNAKNNAYAGILRYLTSVNDFLEGKVIHISTQVPKYRGVAVGIKFADGATSRGLRVLSSGERQIASLIYASTHMSKQAVVLIDEPEISLHVDWQRLLIRKMMEQLGERQIITCTHSPVIGADFEERLRELHLKPTGQPRSLPEQPADEESAV